MGEVFIYCLIDPVTGHVRYVGKTVDLSRRYRLHINQKENTWKGKWIQSLIKKDLKPNLFVVDTVNNEDWEFWEQFYICLFKAWGFTLTNLDEGGRTTKYRAKETIEKLRKASTGKPGYWLGKKRDPEMVKRSADKIRGRKQSEEEKQKRIKSCTGKKRTKEQRKAMSDRLIGKKLSESHKKSLSDGHTRKLTVAMYSLDGKKIKSFNSIKEASDYLGKKHATSGILRCARGERKTAFKYKWKLI